MAQSTTVSYHSDRCDHTNLVEFDSDEQPWKEKTRGCSECGTTSQFTKVNDESNSNTNSETEVDSGQKGEQTDVEDTEVSFDDVEYQQLRSIAARIDSVETNQSHDELLSDLRDVDDSTLDSAITEVNNDE